MITQPIRQALDHGDRPDPAAGIFETILIEHGLAPMMEAHYARMNASARDLYGIDQAAPELPPPEAPRRWWTGRMRITYVPGEGPSSQPGGLGPDPVYTGIAPFVLSGGLGRHKWADRRLVDALGDAAAGALSLLIDTDGAVLEVTWANVLIEERGRLVSPPDDGRALPGIGRSSLQYDEEPVDLDRLLAADAVVLTSALRTVRIPLAV